MSQVGVAGSLAATVLCTLFATSSGFVLAPAPVLWSGHLPASSALTLRCSVNAGAAPYVALTRELGKNGKLQKILESRGIVGKELPCITFENLGAPLAATHKDEWEYIVETSPEAASVFCEGWAGNTLQKRSL
jgi:hypothetical protein